MTLRELAIQLRQLIEKAAISLNDEDALNGIELFPVWGAGINYKANQRIRYQQKLYRVIQAHTSQDGWEPDKTPSLWAEVAKPGEIPVWKQPLGAEDAYHIDDKVHYPTLSDPIYRSTVDNNVWSPDTYGWEQI